MLQNQLIFSPIFQIGWFTACVGVANFIYDNDFFLNGPPDPVSKTSLIFLSVENLIC